MGATRDGTPSSSARAGDAGAAVPRALEVLLSDPAAAAGRGPAGGPGRPPGPGAVGPDGPGGRAARVRHVHRRPAQEGRRTTWPAWADPEVVAAWRGRGVAAPWEHQARAADLLHAGRSVVLATGTASGKSLGYWLPALTAARGHGSAATAWLGGATLYLSPTKALAADQLAALEALAVPGVTAAVCDGDTPAEERAWVRRHADVVLTNPDMLSRSLLPDHARWRLLLRRLRYVVVDEAHVYRGLLGSHVAAVLRRLLRVAALHGSTPAVALASATTAAPGRTAERLVGRPVEVVEEDTSARGALSLLLWQPAPLPRPADDGWDAAPGQGADAGRDGASPSGAPGAPGAVEEVARRSATAEAAELLGDLAAAGVRTLAFTRSRAAAEDVAVGARRRGGTRAVAAYRSGYLPEERRALEADLRSGRLVGLATTSALELGVDVAGLDAVLVAGWPGTRASLWQQAGRAGRAGQDAVAVLVARADPLDTYLVTHPEAVVGAPVEEAVLDPANPHVLAPHLAAAAAEAPLTPEDLPRFGDPALVRRLLDALVRRDLLRRRAAGWFWVGEGRPADGIDLRGSGGDPVVVVEAATGRVVGSVGAGTAHATVHPGAVHVHQGRHFVVEELDLASATAVVSPTGPEISTWARDVSDVRLLEETDRRTWGEDVVVATGTVEVTSQVVSFQRRRAVDGKVLGSEPLDLPARVLRTRAVWWTATPDLLEAAGVHPAAWPGALHAAEHAAIGLLPLVATNDRWDVGGVSTALHAGTGLPTVVVHDAAPGGAGFAARGFAAARTWLTATADAVAACPCRAGCPACVQSPKCGNGNDPLDKDAAVRVLRAVLAAADADVRPTAG
ncbi:DEAD/DEAH box helicase [Pseudokineococcus lusitanus]|uniref:DEAD/DEAH box helicase domain-containing protein n=1 Tax=Pseudokineococcus lusitanus TaxID=763993 RepID=A0A3N1HPV2_9ACTN|nr:DEAD/DEAH box helicase [Pseudokineococcus lusitanus]ROP44564.1 DEAD/DEAH box helicase domain-containing protein [Pseudokineococcus lusitanus]